MKRLSLLSLLALILALALGQTVYANWVQQVTPIDFTKVERVADRCFVTVTNETGERRDLAVTCAVWQAWLDGGAHPADFNALRPVDGHAWTVAGSIGGARTYASATPNNLQEGQFAFESEGVRLRFAYRNDSQEILLPLSTYTLIQRGNSGQYRLDPQPDTQGLGFTFIDNTLAVTNQTDFDNRFRDGNEVRTGFLQSAKEYFAELLTPDTAEAAVAFTGTASSGNTGTTNATTLTFSHTVSSADLLVVGGSCRCAGDLTGITWNGVALTFVTGAVGQASSYSHTEVFIKTSPADGTSQSIVITYDTTAAITGGATNYTGVDTADPYSDVAVASGNNVDVTADIANSTTDGKAYVIYANRSNDTDTVNAIGADERWEDGTGFGDTNDVRASALDITGTGGTINYTWSTQDRNQWVTVGFNILASAGTPEPTPTPEPSGPTWWPFWW